MIDMKKTRIYKPSDLEKQTVQKDIIDTFSKGENVVFPTETVYGIGADALNEKGVQNIYRVKKRPSDNPLIVHLSSKEALLEYIYVDQPYIKALMDAFWPGPLTMVFRKKPIVPGHITGGLNTVGIRVPMHPVALKVLSIANMPICAPSANISGRPSSTLFDHVIDDFKDRVEIIVDGGKSDVGLESTVLDVTQKNPVILRPGVITKAMIERIIQIEVQVSDALLENEGPKAPGMKYKHYSPQADVLLIEGRPNKIATKINSLATSLDEKVGIMATTETLSQYDHNLVKDMGSRNDLREISTNLFKLLREFDQEAVDIILVEGVNETGVGVAIMNRLRKAAGKVIKIS